MKQFGLAVLILSALQAMPAWANDEATVEKWYVALGKADAAALGELLTPTAVIRIKDVGTAQTKAEFLSSMDEWRAAIDGGSIRHKADGSVDNGLAYRVCYDFAENDLMTREVFSFEVV